MVEYATLLSISFRNMLQGFHLDYQMLMPGILLAGALVLILIRLLKSPKL
jgi:hypothetical protein